MKVSIRNPAHQNVQGRSMLIFDISKNRTNLTGKTEDHL